MRLIESVLRIPCFLMVEVCGFKLTVGKRLMVRIISLFQLFVANFLALLADEVASESLLM